MRNYSGKKIDGGWQYTVYDLGNSRVYKKFNSKFESFKIILKDRWFVFWKIPSFISEMKNNAIKSFEFIEHGKIDKVFFGNIIRTNELDYTQDKMITLGEYFKNHTLEENKIIIDKFIELCKFFLERSFIDKAIKIGSNFGINDKGEIALIDIGEIWFKEESIKTRIKKRTWAFPSNYKGVPVRLQKYYIQKMDRIYLHK